MTTPTNPPYDEDLTPPNSAYPSIPLGNTVYPENGVWGIGRRHVISYGTFLTFPWARMSLNDTCELYIQDPRDPVAWGLVTDVNIDSFSLSVREEAMPEGEVPIFSRVLRAGSQQESRSVPQTILIKTTRPGGDDQRQHEPWHSELIMSVEGLPPGSTLNADNVAAGITCLIEKYPNIRKNDVITIAIGGEAVTHTVSPQEAAGAGPIRVFISPDVLKNIQKRGDIILFFRVRDVVENTSGGKFPHSKIYPLRSELDSTLLMAPFFLVDGVDIYDTLLVDLDVSSRAVFELDTSFGTRRPPAGQPPNTVTAILDLNFPDGTTRTVNLAPVIDTNRGHQLLPLPNELITQLAGGWLRARFKWESGTGVLLGESASVTVQVVGTPVLMPAVTVSPIEAGMIPTGTDITVTLPNYQPHDPNWLETLVLEQVVPGGGGTRVVQAQPAGVQGGTRRVTRDTLKAFDGKGPFQIYYLTNDGRGTSSSIRDSVRLDVEVGQRVEELPAPDIRFSVGSNIDPDNVGDEAELIFPYNKTAEGDVLSWSVIGQRAIGSASGTLPIKPGYEGEQLPTIFVPVDRRVLDNNIDSSIRISYSVQSPSGVKRSLVRELTVGQQVILQPPEVLQAGKAQQELKPEDVFQGATVRARYTPMRTTDQIFVKWVGSFGISFIEVQLTGDPSKGYVDAIIPPEIIAKGIRPGGNIITVQYLLIRGSSTYTSVELKLQLLPMSGLPTPTIEGIGDTQIMLTTQLKDAARILVGKWPLMDKDQYMWLSLQGTYDDDTLYYEDIYTASLVGDTGVAQGISPPAPVAKLRRLKDGSSLTIRFACSFARSTDRNTAVPFGVRTYLVQSIPSTLPAPQFARLPGAAVSIYPLDYETTASVRVAYPGMKNTHTIAIKWVFPDATTAISEVKPGATTGYVDFPISQQTLAASVGKVITLRYVATINGALVTSAVQTLTVQTIRPADLPRPLINGLANNTLLDLNTFTDNGLASVRKWRLSASRQRVWMKCSSDYVPDLVVLDGVAITGSQALNGLADLPVLRSWLRRVKSSKITVTCKVTFDGSYDETKAVAFPSTNYDIRWELGILETITVGAGPHFMALTPDGATAYLTNTHSNTVSVINVAQRRVEKNLEGFIGPYRILLHPTQPRLYVQNLFGNTISVVDLISQKIIQTFTGFNFAPVVAGFINRAGLDMNTDGTLLYVVSQYEQQVYVIDAQSGARLNSMAVNIPSGLAFNPRQRVLYIGGPTQAYLASAGTPGGVIGAIPGFTTVFNIDFTPDDKPYPRAYVTAYHTFRIIDTQTNHAVREFPLTYTFSLAMNPVIPECYVGTNAVEITVFNTQSEAITRRIPGFFHPAGIVVHPSGRFLMVANHSVGTLSYVAV